MSPSPLERRLSALLDKRRSQSKLRTLKSTPAGSVDFSSNDFLSLSSNKDFQNNYLTTLNKSRTPLGSTGSRLLDGNSQYAENLECEIATFHGAEAGLLTNSGFDANVSIFAFLPRERDVIIYDELIHASVHDGMRQSRATTQIPFKHNDIDDLSRILEQVAPVENSSRTVFVAVETVYSMDGDLAPLTEIVELVESAFPRRNAHLIVDEAHATGIYGPNGSGRVCELGLEKRISIRLHTFGKALACNGGIILCSPILRLYLINYARPLIYTTFMSYPALVAIKTAYAWLQMGKANLVWSLGPSLAANLYHLIHHLYTQLQTLETAISQATGTASTPLVTLPKTCPESPIFALLSPYPRSLAAHCQSAAFIVRPVVSPTVPIGTERVRVCLHSGNTVEQIDSFVSCVRRWLMQEGMSGKEDSASPLVGSLEVGPQAEKQLLAKL
ncbi:aminotransferase [Exophiala viscosa]|uniref:aminotransferase n=1 Tax=Exophiala viscosa TaxID=2486360 RepID=UPI00219E3898|nr:aminotransferase [Exophiala viscosa]